MTSVSTLGTRGKKEYDLKKLDEEEPICKEETEEQQQPPQQTTTSGGPYPFMPLYSHYTLGHRLKSTVPFSKLFFSSPACCSSNIQDTLIKSITTSTSNHSENSSNKNNNNNDSAVKSLSKYEIIHDKEQCMFLIKLDSQGRTVNKLAALCYLPTRVKNVIEVYHTEIPILYRHQGLGDKLVKECLGWAKESGTLVIPTCHFVKRHLEYVGHQKYDSIIVKSEQEGSKFPLDIQTITYFSL